MLSNTSRSHSNISLYRPLWCLNRGARYATISSRLVVERSRVRLCTKLKLLAVSSAIDSYFTYSLEHRTSPGPAHFYPFRNKACFYGYKLLISLSTPKLAYYLLSAVRHCLFNIFAATLRIEGCSSVRNLRTRHAVVIGTHLLWLFHVRHLE